MIPSGMAQPPDPHELYLHVRVLVGVVLGLGLTRILSGLARMVEHPGRNPVSATHLLWVAVILLSIVHFWWWEFTLISLGAWRFELFVFLLLYAFLWFVLACLLFPGDLAEHDTYEAYFLSRRRWFFGLFAATFAADLIDTAIKGAEHFRALGPEYPARIAAGIVLCAIAAWTGNRRFHLLFAALYLAYDLSWILRLYDTLG
jgi:hypothetical protein